MCDEIIFNGFKFYKLSTLEYILDGKDKEYPSQMFIEDKEKRFLISLDVEMKDIQLMVSGKEDYDTIEFFHHNKSFRFCYPCQIAKKNLFMGYFSIDFKNRDGDIRTCIGQLSIAPPQKYIEGIKKYENLQDFFSKISLYES